MSDRPFRAGLMLIAAGLCAVSGCDQDAAPASGPVSSPVASAGPGEQPAPTTLAPAVDARGAPAWQTLDGDFYREQTLLSPDGQLAVTTLAPRNPEHNFYCVQVRLHCDAPGVADVLFSWPGGEFPDAHWKPMFTQVARVPTAGGGAAPAWLLLGWTARGAADSTLYAWLVAPRGRRLAVAQVSLSGGAGHTRMIWMPASGRLGLFLPQDPALRAGCKANVAGREIPPADLAASAVAPPQRSGTWYARDRLVGEDPGPGSVWWVDLSALLADMPAELLTRPQPATQPTTAPDR